MNNNRLSLTHQTVEADEHHIDEDDEGECNNLKENVKNV